MDSSAISYHTISDRQALSLNAFVENFYRLTDDSAAHSEYASQFFPGATLIVNHNAVQGEGGIISLRNTLWSLFSSQKHTIENVIYSLKPPSRIESKDYRTVEAIIFGTVTTVSRSKEQRTVEWAGRAEYISQDDMKWHVWRYQVYVNSKSRTLLKI